MLLLHDEAHTIAHSFATATLNFPTQRVTQSFISTSCVGPHFSRAYCVRACSVLHVTLGLVSYLFIVVYSSRPVWKKTLTAYLHWT